MEIKYSVKEKRNLFPCNLWALGDIEPLPDLNRNNYSMVSYSKTTTYHTNGNYGLIATCTKNDYRSYIRYWINDVSELIGETISYSADVKTTKALNLKIYQYDGSTYSSTSVTIPENNENRYIVTTNVKDTTTALWIGIEFQTAQQEGETFYTDNWELKIIPQ